MGYYTHYELVLPSNLSDELLDKINHYIQDDDGYLNMAMDGEPCTWYEHEKDMLQMSRVFPDVLFELNGTGEESGDIWKKYFYNNTMQERKAKIVFEPPDPL